MALPFINMEENTEQICLFWEPLDDPSIKMFNLYWSLDKHLAFSLITECVPNTFNYHDKYTKVCFDRTDIGLPENKDFYVRIVSADFSNTEIEEGEPKYIPQVNDPSMKVETTANRFSELFGYDKRTNEWYKLQAHLVVDQESAQIIPNCGLTECFNESKVISTTSENISFLKEVKLIEIFNMSETSTIYIELCGGDADPATSMPIFPQTYYAFSWNVRPDKGFNIIADPDPADVRIVGHRTGEVG